MRAPLAAAFVLVALLLTALPAPGGHEPGHPARGREPGPPEGQPWANLSEGQRAAAHQRAERAHLFGPLTAADGEASGRYVRFGYDNDTGDLRDYAVLDTVNATFFALVHPGSWGGNLSEAVHGASFRLASDAGRVRVQNNPTGQFAVRAIADLEVTLQLAANASVAGNVSGNKARISAGAAHGHLLVAGNGTLESPSNGTLVARLQGGTLVFLAHPARGAGAQALHERVDALAAGTLGAEATVVEADGAPAAETESFGVQLTADHAGNRSVRLRADSSEPRGRAIVVRTDNATVPAGRPEEVRVLLDGVALARAANAVDALNATPGQGRAFVSLADGGLQAIVVIPGFSEHVVEVTSAPEGAAPPPATPPASPPASPPATPPPSERPAPGVAGGLGLVALAGAALALATRRR